ncbi:MAG: hypothetical protein Q7U35_10720 [Methanobacteriaceae archaeon]|nr:hypothetical protein [Methanobacteriaceae archaeon]MDP2836993.1 hypothetical protein [Methanobacteriaceae archaeon]MDP3034835.1 hypothetical protein [Methanobacteriaceae archaeon]MDP3485815.1 hypothetical protein [Methanobacteriaceae archaeon]MDP3624801.1 hypothetical protein [Methanobacteriaceae archaeon]
MPKSTKLLNTMTFLVNKSIYKVLGENSRTLSRLSAKYVVNYLDSQSIIDKNNLTEEGLKKAFIEEMGLADDLLFDDTSNNAVLTVINPVLMESIIELNKENIPITIAPCIIYVYLLGDLYNYKISFQKVEYDKKNNNTVWTFKKH